MLSIHYIPGEHYKRAEIHDQFGGNRQRGISASAKESIIFIFSGSSGTQYGYSDGWNENKTLFMYTGEGQVGDQTFTMGNKALRDHVNNSKDVLLFHRESNGLYRFDDQLTLIDYELKQALDRDGHPREVIQFIFESATSMKHKLLESERYVESSVTIENSLEELKTIALQDTSTGDESIQIKQVKVRKRSEAIKLYARKRAAGICEACEQPEPFESISGSSLEVHHMYKLSDGGPDHPEHVAAICPNCHARIHRGIDGSTYNQELIDKIEVKENPFRFRRIY